MSDHLPRGKSGHTYYEGFMTLLKFAYELGVQFPALRLILGLGQRLA